MQKKQFVLEWLLRERPRNKDNSEAEIHFAKQCYEAWQQEFPASPKRGKPIDPNYEYETPHGVLKGDDFQAFQRVWALWNNPEEGKKDAGGAFLKQIKGKPEEEKKRIFYKMELAAKDFAENIRPKLEQQQKRIPYFPKWCNAGRWDLDTLKPEQIKSEAGQFVERYEKLKKEKERLMMSIREHLGAEQQFRRQNMPVMADKEAQKAKNDLEQLTKIEQEMKGAA